MALFPKIQSPCPYKANLAAAMDGDMCRMCKRQVHDITDWSDQQRLDFLAACQGEVCVSYRLPRVAAAAAVALTALAAPMAAAAQDCPETYIDATEVGGLRDLGKVEMVEVAADQATPVLPVVYEDAPPVAQTTADKAPAPSAAPPAAQPVKSGGA